MAKASPIILSFATGEMSQLLDGRVDLEEYPTGCRTLRNFIPLLQGPARRRDGTVFVRAVKDSTDRCGWLRFEFNVEQAYVLEIGDQYMRFYTDHGIVMNGTNPLELITPWAVADLYDAAGNFLLRSVQSGDVLYITHTGELYPPQKLTRTGALSWSIADVDQEGGPFEDVDPDETVTMYASGNTGSITVTSSGTPFTSDHVGALLYLEQVIDDDTPQWEPAKSITDGDIRRVENRNYEAENTATTGTIIPSHTIGSVFDGDTGVQWTFLDPGYGWGIITAVASGGGSATVTVQSRIPNGAVASGNATTRWAFGAWSDVAGWPTHVTFFRERLVFARASTRQVWLSVSGDFENFKNRDDAGDLTDDSAISIEIASDKVNRIEWLVPSGRLIVGTAGGEFVVGEITDTEPLGPANIKSDPESSYGSKPVQAVRVGNDVHFVQRSGRKLRDFAFSFESENLEGYKSQNMNILAPHLLPNGTAITQLAYQQEPNSVMWVLRSDGVLLGVTLNLNKRGFGWHRHPIGGVFGTGEAVIEAIEVIPNPEGDADELWLIVKRTVDGSTVRYVEYMDAEWRSEDDIITAVYVDSSSIYDGAVAQTLTPGVGATVVGTEEVEFTAGGNAFVSGDVGREIWERYQDADGTYTTSRAEITAVNSATVVEATILVAFRSVSAIASGGWRLTATTISGLDHLEGETVDVLGDGAVHPQVEVTSGSITLQLPVSYAVVGLPAPCSLQTMRLEAGAADGTAQGKTKRVTRCAIRLVETVGGTAGPDEDGQDQILFRDASMAMDEAIPPFSGDKEIAWPSGYEVDAYLRYENDLPLPATVVAFMPQVVTQDR
jgi:hypothetical protein